jgi:hypothetical protein
MIWYRPADKTQFLCIDQNHDIFQHMNDSYDCYKMSPSMPTNKPENNTRGLGLAQDTPKHIDYSNVDHKMGDRHESTQIKLKWQTISFKQDDVEITLN